ncbi:MAG TPA: hypothetical protein VKW08_27145 [Xanthobacteraceae bacterium]|nr:hypothetical protein [Xanthobacteraceae bacterium]
MGGGGGGGPEQVPEMMTAFSAIMADYGKLAADGVAQEVAERGLRSPGQALAVMLPDRLEGDAGSKEADNGGR